MSSSWKVAYADFMTAMMAFFLLMWILNMAPKETKVGLAGYFTEGPKFDAAASPMGNTIITQKVDKLDIREFQLNEVDKSHYAIAQEIKQFILAETVALNASGITSTSVGVLLHVANNAMFLPNSVELSPEGITVLEEVTKIMRKYKVYLVVRGHTAKGETGEPEFPSKWELSSARGTAAIRYLVEIGKIDSTLIRSVAYADTRPAVQDTDPEAAEKNRRIEFYFHRPETMSSVVGY